MVYLYGFNTELKLLVTEVNLSQLTVLITERVFRYQNFNISLKKIANYENQVMQELII